MGAILSSEEQEFTLTDADFVRIRKLIKERSGIDMSDAKRSLVYGRLARRVRALQLTTFSAYLELVDDASSDEGAQFLNALTTNVTELFREQHHFELLAERIVSEAARSGRKKLRIWSAGCSLGDEPYSIAITLTNAPVTRDWDVKILATDIDTDVLAQARRGIYPAERVTKLTPGQRAHFLRGTSKNEGLARVSEQIRGLVTFKQLNLHGTWPMQGPFDVVFCRNVLIYFDAPARERLVRRFANILKPGGYLCLGHSEAASAGVVSELKPCSRTAFVKAPTDA